LSTPQFRAGVTSSDPNGALAVTVPATVQAGDLILITYHTALSTAPTDLPSGYAYVPEDPGPAGVHTVGTSRMAAIYKIATSGDASSVVNLAVTAGAPVKQTCELTAWSGVDPANPFHKVAFLGNSAPTGTSQATSAVTTTLADCTIVIWLGSKDSAVTSITPPATYTDRGHVYLGTGGGRSNSAQASKAAASVGSYGGESWTTDATPSNTGAWTLAIAPAVTTQTMRPASDITATNVADQTGASTNLYTRIDEATLDTADYVRGIQGATYEALLSTAATPPPNSGLDVTYPLGLGDGATAATVDTYLMQGATQIAHWTDNVSADNTTFTHSLTSTQFNNITSWSDLRLRWVFTSVS
jgi:hypothetical protein